MSPKPLQKLKPFFKPRPRKVAAAPQPASPRSPGGDQAVVGLAPPPATGASDGALAERRDQLARQYAELQSDLGGLVYEMAIRDYFRLDVVTRQAAKLQAVDAQLAAVERQLQGGAPAAAPSCNNCGASLQPGAAFCAQCGTALATPLATAAALPVGQTPVPPAGAATR
jgi:zinc-ribbon domain